MRNPYEPILKEVASGMLETAEIKKNYSNDAFLDVSLIFQNLLMNKLYENQDYDKMPFDDRCNMAEACGKELRKLIHTFTGLDTIELVKNYGK